MKCPNDNATLVMTERQGIEIDYCPECRGVWLDKGELDKIIDRASEVSRPLESEFQKKNDDRNNRYEEPHRNEEQYKNNDYQRHHGKKKREGFLSDLFDFGD